MQDHITARLAELRETGRSISTRLVDVRAELADLEAHQIGVAHRINELEAMAKVATEAASTAAPGPEN